MEDKNCILGGNFASKCHIFFVALWNGVPVLSIVT